MVRCLQRRNAFTPAFVLTSATPSLCRSSDLLPNLAHRPRPSHKAIASISRPHPPTASLTPPQLAHKSLATHARRPRTSARFRPLIDFVLSLPLSPDTTLVDVGTGHGYLAASLASTERFCHVLGVDYSAAALASGAYTLPPCANLSFRRSDGLGSVQRGEGDVVVAAGLACRALAAMLTEAALARVKATSIVLQPLGDAPRDLLFLYEALRRARWAVRKERVVEVGGRCYFCLVFERGDRLEEMLPGSLAEGEVWDAWRREQRARIQQDIEGPRCVSAVEMRWLNEVGKP